MTVSSYAELIKFIDALLNKYDASAQITTAIASLVTIKPESTKVVCNIINDSDNTTTKTVTFANTVRTARIIYYDAHEDASAIDLSRTLKIGRNIKLNRSSVIETSPPSSPNANSRSSHNVLRFSPLPKDLVISRVKAIKKNINTIGQRYLENSREFKEDLRHLEAILAQSYFHLQDMAADVSNLVDRLSRYEPKYQQMLQQIDRDEPCCSKPTGCVIL